MRWHGPAWFLKSRVKRSKLQPSRVRNLPQPEKMASSSESEVEWRMAGKDKGKLIRRVVSTQAASISVGEEDFEESTRLATATSTETEGRSFWCPRMPSPRWC